MKNLWRTVDPGLGENPSEEDLRKDHSAKSMLYLIVNNSTLDDLINCKTAKEIWDALKQIHTKYDKWHGLLLLKDFINTKKKNDESIDDYLARRNGLYHKVQNAGYKFEENVQTGFAVHGLPVEHEYLSRNLRADKNV